MPLPSRELQIDKEMSAQGTRYVDTQCSVVRLPLTPEIIMVLLLLCDGTKLSGLTYTRKIEVVRQGFFSSNHEHFQDLRNEV
jgi:hypothetical protein